MTATAPVNTAKFQQRRAFWLKHLHQWHWISAAACLVGMLLFSLTGFTLNHAAWIGAKPHVISVTAQLPPQLLTSLKLGASAQAMPANVIAWLDDELSVRPRSGIEWSEDEVYLSLPQPGGDAWATIDLDSGEIIHEVTDRGWLAYFNDLHKGRNAGAAWSLFIDLFALMTLVFATTGLLLLKMHSTHRPATWPVVGLGLVMPLIIALLFIH
jgi:hypothetical protein